jgi:hypothetical protein
LRLHRIKKSWIGLKYYRDLAATPPEKAKAEIAVRDRILGLIL